MSEKPSTTLPGTVEKIIKSPHPGVPEKAQISVEAAGVEVEVTVEAKPEDTIAG